MTAGSTSKTHRNMQIKLLCMGMHEDLFGGEGCPFSCPSIQLALAPFFSCTTKPGFKK